MYKVRYHWLAPQNLILALSLTNHLSCKQSRFQFGMPTPTLAILFFRELLPPTWPLFRDLVSINQSAHSILLATFIKHLL